MIEPGNRNDCDYNLEHGDWTMFVHVHEDTEKSTLTRDVTLFREINGHYRKSKELHHVMLYPYQLIISLLEKAGFQVSIFKKYNELTLDEHHIGFFCTKPAY